MRVITALIMLTILTGCGGDDPSTPGDGQGYVVEGTVAFQGTRIPIGDVRVTIGETTDTTADDGRFRIAGVASGPQTVTAEREGFDPNAVEVDVSGNVVVTMPMSSAVYTALVSGQVTGDIVGNPPVLGATVRVVNPDGTPSALVAETDVDGFYALAAVPVGHRTLSVRATAFVSGESELDVTGPACSHSMIMAPATGGTLPSSITGALTLHSYHSPYIVGAAGVDVEDGASLVVEAGVEVRCAANAAVVVDAGAVLQIQGMAENPASFVAADAGGEWDGLTVQGAASISNLRLEDASAGLHLVLGPSAVSLESLTISGCGVGIRIDAGPVVADPLSILGSTVQDCGVGIRVQSAEALAVALERCIVSDCAQNGLEISGGDIALDVDASVFSNNGENGIYCGFNRVDLTGVLDGINVENNGNNGIQVDGYGGAVIDIEMRDSNLTGNGNSAVDLFRQCTGPVSLRSTTTLDAVGNWWGIAPPDPGDFVVGRSSSGGSCQMPVIDYSGWSVVRLDNGADQLER